MMRRSVIAPLVAVLAVAQAWDSGVFGAGATVIALVLGGIALLVAAVLFGRDRDYAVLLLLAGGAQILIARAVSPVNLNELFIILPIAAMPFILLKQLERRTHSGA